MAKDKFGVVAAVTGIDGDEQRLKQLMNSTGEIDIMERATLMVLFAEY